jgi:hypothetical protein
MDGKQRTVASAQAADARLVVRSSGDSEIEIASKSPLGAAEVVPICVRDVYQHTTVVLVSGLEASQ